ncbi:acyl--CoA ligase [Cohaesibacter sp. CAU 1516]|uniref:AMP-binding protein n=1 Tax=Cohaesibacter sp. CAU 1516 TaxID=2576038 RepID=UPI0010FE2EBD|nr:AMP-binding protein [Cohaesibacter sp. CAU 1516]TLP49116.1 acyl--CoA ligase [Cohaesibacter sp. CAU 1516]
MLLNTPDHIETYRASGLWGTERIDQRFAHWAQERADEIALIDDQTLHTVCGRQPQCLSFGRAWRRVVAISEFLSGIGMKSDTVVAVLLPPSVDAAILTLVASRMGLILAPIPLTSGEADIRNCLEQVGAKAIVCCPHYESEPVGERARNVAADMFSIRFVFCLGDGAPEGLIELQSMMDDEDTALDEETLFDIAPLPDANSVLAIHWASAGSVVSKPLGRSHNQLLCASRHVYEQTGLEPGDCLMMAYHLSGLTGFAAGIITAFDAGIRLQFHQFRNLQGFNAALSEYGVQHIMLPGGQWRHLHPELVMAVREQLKSISLIWSRSHAQGDVFPENETAARLLDVTNFGELALLAQIRRLPGEIGSVPLGTIEARNVPGAAYLETHLLGVDETKAKTENGVVGGELCLKGAMVPTAAFPSAGAIEGTPLRMTEHGFVRSDVACQLVTERHGDERALFRPLGDISDLLSMGGLTERAVDIDTLYKQCPGVTDAAAFTARSSDGGPDHLLAALVVHDEETAREDFYAFLKSCKVSSTKWPRDILFVQAIPRSTDGRVQRGSLIEAAKLHNVA